MSRRQRTLKAAVELEGVGIHTGQRANLRIEPAAPGHGRVFVREGVPIPAVMDYVVKVERSTTLGSQGVTVQTVEHLLSAAAGLGLDNLAIHIDGPEVPIMDGSALPFAQAFGAAGVHEQEAIAPCLSVTGPRWVASGDCLVIALPGQRLELEYAVHYPQHPLVPYQHCSWGAYSDYLAELAPARTYAFWEEVQDLLARGLARGGDLSNALVIKRDGYTSTLRFEDEPVRHKCLDLLGDLALLGCDLAARVLAVRAGHRLHVELVRKILEEENHAGCQRDPSKAAPSLSVPAAGPSPGA